jgi:hypothetical protein
MVKAEFLEVLVSLEELGSLEAMQMEDNQKMHQLVHQVQMLTKLTENDWKLILCLSNFK